MKRLVIVTGILSLAVPLALAQTSTWAPDKAHSEVDFSILHLGLSHVHGRFGNIGGTIALDESDVTKSSVAQFPTATFVSTSIAKNGMELTIRGNLTLRGVTKPVTLEAEGPVGPVPGMDHKSHSAFSASTTISRSAFGIASKYPAAVIGDDVKLTIELDIAKQ